MPIWKWDAALARLPSSRSLLIRRLLRDYFSQGRERLKLRSFSIRFFPQILFSLVLGLSAGCAAFHRDTLDRRIETNKLTRNGIEAINLGEPERAERLLTSSLLRSPDDVQARVYLSNALLAQNQTNRAIEQLQIAVEQSPTQPELHVRLGRLHFSQGQLLPAARHAELAIEIDQKQMDAWDLCGDIACAKSNWPEALAAYQQATSCGGNSPPIQFKIAGVYERMNRPLRALSAYEQVLSHYAPGEQPHDALVRHGNLLTQLRQYRRAIEQLEIASRQPNPSAESFVSLSNAQVLAGQLSDARLTLVRGSEAMPESAVFGMLLGRLKTPQNENLVLR